MLEAGGLAALAAVAAGGPAQPREVALDAPARWSSRLLKPGLRPCPPLGAQMLAECKVGHVMKEALARARGVPLQSLLGATQPAKGQQQPQAEVAARAQQQQQQQQQ
jgi:hypothetical protein